MNAFPDPAIIKTMLRMYPAMNVALRMGGDLNRFRSLLPVLFPNQSLIERAASITLGQ